MLREDKHHRYHESLENLILVDVCFSRGREILEERQRFNRQSLEHFKIVAY